jgi:hypothetical protein
MGRTTYQLTTSPGRASTHQTARAGAQPFSPSDPRQAVALEDYARKPTASPLCPDLTGSPAEAARAHGSDAGNATGASDALPLDCPPRREPGPRPRPRHARHGDGTPSTYRRLSSMTSRFSPVIGGAPLSRRLNGVQPLPELCGPRCPESALDGDDQDEQDSTGSPS